MVVGCTGALALLGGRELMRRQVPGELLGQELSRALGHPARFQRFQLTWDGQLTLDRLELLDPDGRVFLHIDQTRVSLDRSQALRGKVVLRQLLLEHPSLELSGPRWNKLRAKSSGSSTARTFPILIRRLDMRWLSDSGQPTWSASGWQGSLPATAQNHWKLGLQGPGGEVFEADGQADKLQLTLQNFPVSQLATVATGAHYPSLEETARVSLQAQLHQGRVGVQAELQSRAFNGPVQLQFEPDRSGRLTTNGGKLHLLGQIGAAELLFQPVKDGWKLRLPRLQWKGSDWSAAAQVLREDQFEGELQCRKLQWGQAFPLALKARLRGSARQQKAAYELSLESSDLRWKNRALGKCTWTAQGQVSAAGLPDTRWVLGNSRGSWSGQLSWQSASGDLKVGFAPLHLQQWLPGCQGTLQADLQRQEHWKAQVSAARLKLGAVQVQNLQLKLDGQPPQWSGTASVQEGRWKISGPLEEPKVEACWDRWPWKPLRGKLLVRLQREPGKASAIARVEHGLKWRSRPLPRLSGQVSLSPRGFKGQQLVLQEGPLKLPLELSGSWNGQDWKLTSRLQKLALQPLIGVQASLSASLELTRGGLSCQGQLNQLVFQKHPLGDWKASLVKSAGKPAQLKLNNPALALPGGPKVGAWLQWTEGNPEWLARIQAQGVQGTAHFNPARQWLRTEGKLTDVSVQSLPGLPPGVSGKLSGIWTGKGERSLPELDFKGALGSFRWLGLDIPSLPLVLRRRKDGLKAELGPLALPSLKSLGGPDIQGEARLQLEKPAQGSERLSIQLHRPKWQGLPLADLQLEGRLGKGSLEEARVRWDIQPPLIATGVLGSKSRLAAVLHQHPLQALTLGRLACQGLVSGTARFDSAQGGHFQGRVEQLVAAGQALGSGRVELLQKPSWKATGQEFEASEVALLQQRYPGLKARLDWEVWRDSRLQARLTMKKGVWHQQPFPEVLLEAEQDGESWRLSRVHLDLQPALEAQGRLTAGEQKLELQGKLEGQTLADLSRLAGGVQPPDLACRLQGDFGLSSLGERIKMTFRGRALGLTYRGISVGDGNLHIAALPELNGELLLDHPLELQSEAIPGALRGVLPVQPILSVIRLRGVKLAGSLHSPSVSPLWSLPQVKIKLPF